MIAGGGERRFGRRHQRRGLVAAVLTAFVLLARTTVAGAHADLISAAPAPGSTVAGSPATIRLSFSQPLLPSSHVELFLGQFQAVAGVTTQVAGSEMQANLAQPLTAATYTVQWTAVAEDGHDTAGSYQFAVAPASRLAGWQGVPAGVGVAVIFAGGLVAWVWWLNRRRRM